MVKTHYLVCYDITEDPIRTYVSELCKGKGLERIQYSVFYGLLTNSELKELKYDIREVIKDYNANVHYIQVCSSCEKQHEVQISVNLEDVGEVDTINTFNSVDYSEIDEETPYEGGVLIL